jgi:hypothetical protein
VALFLTFDYPEGRKRQAFFGLDGGDAPGRSPGPRIEGHMTMSIQAVRNMLDKFVEPWNRGDQPGTESFQIADRLDEMVATLRFILSRIDRRAAPQHREKLHKLTLSDVEVLSELYREWYDAASDLMAEIEGSEVNGFPVEQAEEFRSDFQRVGLILPDLRVLRGRVDDFRAGQYVSLKDATDGNGRFSSTRKH